MNKYCRICWNTKNWKCPTGEATKLETGDSYVAEKGFGHEEWLFNFSWLLRGYNSSDPNSYRYGFLQPINKFLSAYQGKTFSVLLYTVSPERKFLIIARIDNLFVPKNQELEWALSQINELGWLEQMQREVEALDFDASPLVNPYPKDIVNSRFRSQDVTFYDPRIVVTGNHKILKTYRYHPLDWSDEYSPTSYTPPPITPPITPDDDDSLLRSEEQRMRSASEGTTYNPRHVQLQNRLYRSLCSRFGNTPVHYENDCVDLAVNLNDQITYYEIKMELTVKRCVRLALGQLLEYAHYPNEKRAHKLVVVGDVFPKEDDLLYLKQLRTRYSLPIFYSRWDWDQETLEKEV